MARKTARFDFEDCDDLEELEDARAKAARAVRRVAEKQLEEIRAAFAERRDAIRRELANEIVIDVTDDGGGR